jgi:hypothetical protein
MNNTPIKLLEAILIGALGAGLVAVGQALLAGQTEWRTILGAGLIAAAGKLIPNQIIPTA